MQPADIQIFGDASLSPLAGCLSAALEIALSDPLASAPEVQALIGMSGQRYRVLINHLVKQVPEPRYLEVGSWLGSTLCSAIHGNSVEAVAIDNWTEFNGPSEAFFENLSKFVTAQTQVSVLSKDFRKVFLPAIGKFNIYLFDGPHSPRDQYHGIAVALKALDDEFILIVDDWNWRYVREPTLQIIQDLKLEIIYRVDVRSTLNDEHPGLQGMPTDQHSEWRNGYFLAVLRK